MSETFGLGGRRACAAAPGRTFTAEIQRRQRQFPNSFGVSVPLFLPLCGELQPYANGVGNAGLTGIALWIILALARIGIPVAGVGGPRSDPRRFGPSFADIYDPPAQLLCVQTRNGFGGLFIIGHLDEGEPAGPSGVASVMIRTRSISPNCSKADRSSLSVV